jgi:hypothetical protein
MRIFGVDAYRPVQIMLVRAFCKQTELTPVFDS